MGVLMTVPNGLDLTEDNLLWDNREHSSMSLTLITQHVTPPRRYQCAEIDIVNRCSNRALWRAIVNQAITDLFFYPRIRESAKNAKGARGKAEEVRRTAYWFFFSYTTRSKYNRGVVFENAGLPRSPDLGRLQAKADNLEAEYARTKSL